MTSVFWEGAKEFQRAIDSVIAKQAAASRATLGLAAHVVEREAKEELSTGSHAKGEPTGAAPGEPPDLVTGNLRRSVVVKGPREVGANSWEAEVGPTAVYGRIQELGGDTWNGGILPPRPYMDPALKAAGPEIERMFRDAWAASWR